MDKGAAPGTRLPARSRLRWLGPSGSHSGADPHPLAPLLSFSASGREGGGAFSRARLIELLAGMRDLPDVAESRLGLVVWVTKRRPNERSRVPELPAVAKQIQPGACVHGCPTSWGPSPSTTRWSRRWEASKGRPGASRSRSRRCPRSGRGDRHGNPTGLVAHAADHPARCNVNPTRSILTSVEPLRNSSQPTSAISASPRSLSSPDKHS